MKVTFELGIKYLMLNFCSMAIDINGKFMMFCEMREDFKI